jgi:hypothetical protein
MLTGFTLTIKLPPEDTLLRDLTVTSLSYISEFGEVHNTKVDFLGDVVRVNAPTRQAALEPFMSLFEYAANIADQKARSMRIGMLRNDQTILSKLLRKGVKGYTYLDAIKDFLQTCASTEDLDFSSLSYVEVSDGGIKLGRGYFAAINPLISERYEHGLEFWRLNYSRELQVRLDETWYALILAGFALAAASLVGNDLLIIYLPEDLIYAARSSGKIFEALKALGNLHGFHGKVGEIVHGERCSTEPFPAFVLLVSLSLIKKAEDVGALYMLEYSLPLAFCKLRRAGNVFTMLEKRRVELFDTLKFATKLMREGGQLVEKLTSVARRTLRLGEGIAIRRKNEADFTVYNRFCTLLLQAIQGAYPPFEVAYYGARYDLIDRELTEGLIHVFAERALPTNG